jgi:hypothetical protein
MKSLKNVTMMNIIFYIFLVPMNIGIHLSETD